MKGKGAIALLLGKPSKDDDTEEGAPSSSKGDEGARAYFDEFAQALREEDDDGAFDALTSFVRSCKGDK